MQPPAKIPGWNKREDASLRLTTIGFARPLSHFVPPGLCKLASLGGESRKFEEVVRDAETAGIGAAFC